jgi:hypothetical protein
VVALACPLKAIIPLYGKVELDEQARVGNSLIVPFTLLSPISLFRSSVGAIPAVILLSKIM